MAVIVRIPTPFQGHTGGNEEVAVAPGTFMDIIQEIDDRYPGFAARITDGEVVRGYLHIFVNDVEIESLGAGNTVIGDGDEVLIVPAIAGGALAVIGRTS